MLEHGRGAARVGEGRVPELDLAVRLRRAGKAAVAQRGLAAEDLLNALPGGQAAGDVLEDHRQHHDAVQQLCGVGDGRHDAAGRCRAVGHVARAHQQENRHHRVHQRVDHRVQEGEDHQGPQLRADQRAVGLAKAQLLVDLAHAGLDDADARDVLLQDGVDLVQLRLQAGEEGIRLDHAEDQAAHDEGERAQHDPPEGPVELKHAEHAPEHEHPVADHAAHKLREEVLHLRDVVGHARDERARADGVHLRKGEGHHPPEAVLAHVVAHVLPGILHDHVVHRAAEAAEEHEPDHLQAQPPDQAQVARAAVGKAKHALVHDLAHEAGLQEVHAHLADHEERAEHAQGDVLADVFPHHASPSPLWGLPACGP